MVKDVEQAFVWYRKAADQGYVAAQFALGCCYYYGDEVDKDFEQGVIWLRKAADNGNL